MPVRTYSSGMMIRLAFAGIDLRAARNPDHGRVVDSRGCAFLEKAQRRIEKFVRRSSILVLASHSMELVEQWCNRGLLLHQGRIMACGRIKEMIAAYRKLIASTTEQELVPQLTAG